MICFFPQGDPGAIGKYGPVGFAGDRVRYLSVCLFAFRMFFFCSSWLKVCKSFYHYVQIKTEQVQTIHILPQLVSRMEDESA